MEPITVRRAEWGRGNPGEGALFNHYGKCCLGFACEQAGKALEALTDRAMPSDLFRDDLEIPELLEPFVTIESGPDCFGDNYEVVVDTALADDLSGINDDAETTDAAKEAAIIARAAEDGVTFIFVD